MPKLSLNVSRTLYISVALVGLCEIIWILYNIHIFRYVITFFITIYTSCVLFSLKSTNNQLKTGLGLRRKFTFLLIWTILISLHGLIFSPVTIKDFFLLSYLFLAFTFPFLYKSYFADDLNFILRLILYCDVAYLIFAFLYMGLQQDISSTYNITFIEFSSKYIAYANLLLMLLIYKTPCIYRIISITTFIISFLFAVYEARRAVVFTLLCGLILSLYLYGISLKSKTKQRIYIIFVCAILLVIAALCIEYADTFLKFIISRMDSDSRDSINIDFINGMNYLDLIIGKGIGGVFATKNSGLGSSVYGSTFRDGIETGFWDYVLKGGFLYLLTLLIIYCGAIYNAFIKSKEILPKALACFILIHLLEMYPSGTPLFNLRYCLVWYCIFSCYNKNILYANSPKSSATQ